MPVHLPCVDRLWRLAALEHCRGGLDDLTWGGFARLTRGALVPGGSSPPDPPWVYFKGAFLPAARGVFVWCSVVWCNSVWCSETASGGPSVVLT